ncbi:MAG TPA: YebB family permuted papain-like enzyme [Rhodocyclaceae bacterium]|nr:YebB family permuted papain-like enzyme [Rhodocyclaceae bacterium]
MKSNLLRWIPALMLAACLGSAALAETAVPPPTAAELGRSLQVGDVVFIQVRPYPFRRVSQATQSWVNHVGIVADISGSEPLVAESTFPLSRLTPLARFVARSEAGRVAVARLDRPLTDEQGRKVLAASRERLGVHYDTGFDLHSRGQFCSRFVREVLGQATGVEVGEVETFRALLTQNPDTDLSFWRLWFLGSIPWQRETVTPASLLRSGRLHRVFDGHVAQSHARNV